MPSVRSVATKVGDIAKAILRIYSMRLGMIPSIRESCTIVEESWEGSAPTYRNSTIRLGSSAHHEQDHNNDHDDPDDPDATLWSPGVVGVVATPSAEQEQDHDD
jgi:hypothetical protein